MIMGKIINFGDMKFITISLFSALMCLLLAGCQKDKEQETDENEIFVGAPTTFPKSALTDGSIFNIQHGNLDIIIGKYPWNAIIRGNELYVAVNGDGRIACSPDAVDWEVQDTGDSNWYDIAYGNDMFVAVGNSGDILFSSDASTWTPVNFGAYWSSIIYSNNHFITSSIFNVMASSDDATSWTEHAVSGSWYDIVEGENGFVAVGRDGFIAYSDDAIDWTYQTVDDGTWLSIAYGSNRYVAVNNTNGSIAHSENGKDWEIVNIEADEAIVWRAIAYGAGHFVAVGEKGIMAISENGSEWELIETGTTDELCSLHIVQ